LASFSPCPPPPTVLATERNDPWILFINFKPADRSDAHSVSSEKKKKKDGEGERERERERERRERKAPVSIKRSLRPSPFSRRLSAARLASKCIRLAFRLVKEAEEGARGGGGRRRRGRGGWISKCARG